MTGGSYGADCQRCGERISAASRYCPDCGERQPWSIDEADDNLRVREAYQRMAIRARAVDNDPSNPRPRSFEHALRILISSEHVDMIDEVFPDA